MYNIDIARQILARTAGLLGVHGAEKYAAWQALRDEALTLNGFAEFQVARQDGSVVFRYESFTGYVDFEMVNKQVVAYAGKAQPSVELRFDPTTKRFEVDDPNVDAPRDALSYLVWLICRAFEEESTKK